MGSATVILTFPKSSDAAKFTRALYAEEPAFEGIGAAAFTGEVAAVVRRPTEWCTCVGQQESGGGRRRRSRPKKELSWTRDEATGWWVCVHCHKPSKALVVHATSIMLVGMVDHLPKILGIGEPRTLFEQRVMEVVEFALATGAAEPDLESLTAYEKQIAASTPNGAADPRFGRTALDPGESKRSQRVAARGKRERPRRATA